MRTRLRTSDPSIDMELMTDITAWNFEEYPVLTLPST